jgi:hypothetical protein
MVPAPFRTQKNVIFLLGPIKLRKINYSNLSLIYILCKNKGTITKYNIGKKDTNNTKKNRGKE